MTYDWKRIARRVAAISAISAVVLYMALLLTEFARWQISYSHMRAVAGHMKLPEGNRDLHGFMLRLSRPHGWVATYVAETTGRVSGQEPIIAAAPSHLVGRPFSEMSANYGNHLYNQRATRSIGFTHEGKSYTVGTILGWTPLLEWAHYLGMTAAALAWLALAAWIWLDARDRYSAAPGGWLLLALLTGPVALGVWMVGRPTRIGPPPEAHCPGCGAQNKEETAYCVRCGHSLHATCSRCHKRVELDWEYCGTCGTNLGAAAANQ